MPIRASHITRLISSMLKPGALKGIAMLHFFHLKGETASSHRSTADALDANHN